MISARNFAATLVVGLILCVPCFAFSFAVFGDNHEGYQVLDRIISSINQDKDIVFAVNMGDAVDRGQKASYQRYLARIKKSRVKIYQVMGNHDASFGGYKYFHKYFGPNYCSFDYENAHFIVLDNSFKGTFNKKQYNWLISDLIKNQGKVIFVFFHKPVFEPTEFYPDYAMAERDTSEKLMEVFKKYRVRYVVTGHIHGYGRALREGVVYIGSGGAGGKLHLPYFLGGFHHYVKITVKGDRIKDEVVRMNDGSDQR